MRENRTVSLLRERDLLWEHAPGLYALRGAPLRLQHRLERLIAHTTQQLAGRDEWQTPPAIRLKTLARADYFASFPQWLTVASHLSERESDLEHIARSTDPARAAAAAATRPQVALQPALCYHAYATLEGQTIKSARSITMQGTCWRHEQDAFVPLERGWAFTMREAILIGSQLEVEAFRQKGMRLAMQLAQNLGLDATIVDAEDPFFAPTARGKALLQRVKALKQELKLSVGDHSVAAASFNHHETFFGNAFDIRLAAGVPAQTGCVAFGIERWVLAFLERYGIDQRRWPRFTLRIKR